MVKWHLPNFVALYVNVGVAMVYCVLGNTGAEPERTAAGH